MVCKGICFGHKAIRSSNDQRYSIGLNAVKVVKFSSIGEVHFALVVVIN